MTPPAPHAPETTGPIAATATTHEIPESIRETFAGRNVFGCLPPIFRECCSPHVLRYDLEYPFVRDSFIYATDGSIVVRTLGDEMEVGLVNLAKPDRRMVPDPSDYFEPAATNLPDLIALPDGHALYMVCPECEGTGVALMEDEDTGNLDGDGCESCEGDRVVRPWEPVEVAPGYFLASHYVALLRRFGATVYAPPRPDRPFSFAITYRDGYAGAVRRIEGRVMGMSPDPRNAEFAPEESEARP